LILFPGLPGRGKFGCFGLYPVLDLFQIRQILSAGIRCGSISPVSSHEYFSTAIIREYCHVHGTQLMYLSFVDALVQVCGLSILYPLLWHKCCDLVPIVTLFRMILLITTDQQRDFLMSGGVLILSYMLSQCDSEKLSYFLYLEFYNIAFEITVDELRLQIIQRILMNFEVWMKTPFFTDVVDHWHSTLVHSFDFISMKICSFATLINALQFYLWAEEPPACSYPRMIPPAVVISVRAILLRLITEIYGSKLSSNDFLVLANAIVGVSGSSDSRDLFEIFRFAASAAPDFLETHGSLVSL
jgi:hypothetical protein